MTNRKERQAITGVFQSLKCAIEIIYACHLRHAIRL